MIYVTDVASVDVQHEQFNSSLLKLFQVAYPQEKITFLGDVSHIKILISKNEDITFKSIPVYNKRGGLKEFIRAYYQFRRLSAVVKFAKQDQASQLVVLLIHPFAHFLFKLFGSGKLPIHIVMHGELESVKFNKHFLNKIWGIFQKNALSKVIPNVSYIILGQSIYKNLTEVLPDFSRQSAFILDHPYPFTSPANVIKKRDTLVFATLGVATKAKNTHYFFDLAREAHEKKLPFEFNICGRVYKNMEPYLNEFVNYKNDFGSFTREELDLLTQQSNFTVFYYENSDYSLCASGSFWDTVNAEIPLLYVRNDYFDYYTNIAGPIGLPFDNPKELNAFILSCVGHEFVQAEEYKKYVDNLQKLKYQHMSTENLAQQLRAPVQVTSNPK